MYISKVARRYASALLQLAREQDDVERMLEDIRFIKNTVDGSRELVLFLQSPIIRFDDKRNALEELFGEHVQESTQRFIKLLARKKRANLLGQICTAFIERYNEYAGIIRVRVQSAMSLDDTRKKALHTALEEMTGKTVQMDISLDASLRGGLTVRVDDTIIDGSVKHKLEELENQLLH